MAALSLCLTLVSAFTFWLVVPMFVLPPVAFYCGYRAWRARRPAGTIGTILALLPMVLAAIALPLELYMMNAGYRA